MKGFVVGALLVPLLLALPAAASAAPKSEFFGVMGDGPFIEPIALDLAAEARAMRASGVQSMRLVLYWDQVEPLRGLQRRWERFDRLVAALARRQVRVFPVLYRAPRWARTGNRRLEAAPPRLGPFLAYARAAVRRYGTNGSFWREHPRLPRMTMRKWQIWNEPNLRKYWNARPWPSTYTRLLRSAARAIRRADPRAQIVTAGLTGKLDDLVAQLYDAGAAGAFDAVGVHPYRERVGEVYNALAATRRVIRERGDDAALVASEVSYSSGLGHSTYNLGIEHTEAGQRDQLVDLMRLLVKERRNLGLTSVYWYTWLSWPIGRPVSFEYSGLRRLTGDGRVVSKPALAGFRGVARGASNIRPGGSASAILAAP